MSTADRIFWTFVLVFFTLTMLLGVYLKEAGIAAIFGYLLGEAKATFERKIPAVTE